MIKEQTLKKYPSYYKKSCLEARFSKHTYIRLLKQLSISTLKDTECLYKVRNSHYKWSHKWLTVIWGSMQENGGYNSARSTIYQTDTLKRNSASRFITLV